MSILTVHGKGPPNPETRFVDGNGIRAQHLCHATRRRAL
jgi:hypothetical protein